VPPACPIERRPAGTHGETSANTPGTPRSAPSQLSPDPHTRSSKLGPVTRGTVAMDSLPERVKRSWRLPMQTAVFLPRSALGLGGGLVCVWESTARFRGPVGGSLGSSLRWRPCFSLPCSPSRENGGRTPEQNPLAYSSEVQQPHRPVLTTRASHSPSDQPTRPRRPLCP